MPLSIGVGVDAGTLATGVEYVFANAEASALVARFTTPPSAARESQIDNLVGSLKTAGVWTKLDAFYVLAAHDAQAAQRNWIADAFNLTPQNSPAFTVDAGYAGNGTTSYLATGALSNALSSYQQNSASIGVWCSTEVNTNFGIGTAAGAISRVQPRAGGNAGGRITSNAGGAAAPVASSIGLTAMDRSAAGALKALRNGVQLITGTAASQAPAADEFYLLRDNLVYGAFGISAAFIGGHLTDAEHLATYNALNTYLSAVVPAP